MRIVLIVVGKTVQDWLVKGVNDYVERIGHFAQFQMVTIPDLKNTKNMEPDVQKLREGESILKLLMPGDDLFLLDDKGEQFTSPQMAQWLEKKLNMTSRRLVFIIGGPYGFSKDVYDRVPGRLSLSRMTFSHQMVRLIFVEQLYRAFAIMKGLPYHHE